MSMYGAFPVLIVNGKPVQQKARPVLDCSDDDRLTVQAERDVVDINKIVARLEKGQMSARLNGAEPFYGDVSDLDGLQDALIKVQDANDLFMKMDASIRERFDNDPVKMVEFLADKNNLNEAIELGMAVKPPEVITPPAPDPEPEQ